MRETTAVRLDALMGHKSLSLVRTPYFLRVVKDADGTIDALDQLDDAPKPTEQVYAYVRDGPPQFMILCSRRNGCRRERYVSYKDYMPQPDEATMRDNALWSQWCHEEHEKRTDHAKP